MLALADRPAVSSSTDAGPPASPTQVAVLDGHGCVLSVNAAWTAPDAQFIGAGATIGSDYVAVCEALENGTGPERAAVAGLRAVVTGKREEFVTQYVSPDGTQWFNLLAAHLSGTGGARFVVQHYDFSTQHEAETTARFRSQLLDAVDAAVVSLDSHGRVTAWSHGAETSYGWTAKEAIGAVGIDLLLPPGIREQARANLAGLGGDGRWEGQVELQRRDGSRFQAWMRNIAMRGPEGRAGFVGVSIDMTDELRDARELRAAREYMRVVADSIGDGLCTLDGVGRIVYVNPRGEQLSGWTLDELAGKDFHDVLRCGCAGSADPAGPLAIATASGGAVRSYDHQLLRRDGSLLPVRHVITPFETNDGVGGFVLVFSDITELKRREEEAAGKLLDLACIEQINHALANDRFVLHAQPIVSIGSETADRYELLIRMLGDDGELIPPDRFLPVAERYGLIGKIDRWVVCKAMDLATSGHAVALNVSSETVSDRTFCPFVAAELERSGADPAKLVFELTETALMLDEASALQFATTISGRGCGLALDDFGTGYGGFSYLKRFPVDYLKIDIEFVRDLITEPASRQVVEAVVNLARGFGIQTIAEGVENEATLTLLREMGVDLVQGYHLGHPRPLAQMTAVAEGIR